MARVRMVTRTITTNIFTVMAVNMKTVSVENIDVPASVEIDTIEKAEKYFRKNWNVDGYLFGKVSEMKTEEKIYGMTEEEFLKYAKEVER